ncbi:MAG TPA: CRTAC1 family protein [Verrucomicrobiales bacterium]|nr:CRTAC1 family protein [Verrucomicrobiales bacterium]
MNIDPCSLFLKKKLFRTLSRLSHICRLTGVGLALLKSQETSPEHVFTLQQLEQRKIEQMNQADDLKAFHGFQFEDRLLESNIRFTNRVVDDASFSYKAAHYDHGNGLAAADVDGDGLIDLYFTTQLGINQLWRNLGNGKFQNITGLAGVALSNQIAVGASFADFDNDGDPDLFVTTVKRGNHLFENLDGQRFKDISSSTGVDYRGHSSGSVFLDYDRDGLLDLFVVNVGAYTRDQRGRGGFYQAYEDAFSGHLFPERSETSILYRNLGNGKFKDVSQELGFQDASWSGDATFTDLNQDGYPDLYLVNMQGDDHFYLNRKGEGFDDKTAEYFPKTPWGAMGVKFFDFNQDGSMDLYVTDMHSDMTEGQTRQALRFDLSQEKAKSEQWCSIQWTEEYLQGASNNLFGNALYLNQGTAEFKEVSDQVGAETYWPWGFSIGDFNADGYEDAFVCGGMGYPFRYGINSLLLNDGGRRFYDVEFILGVEPRQDGRTERVWFALDCDGIHKDHRDCKGKSGKQQVLGTLSTRSSVIVDLDNDGDLDLVTNDFNGRPQVLLSNLTDKKTIQYLKIRLNGSSSNRDGLGATVKVTSGGKTWTQSLDGKSGYLSQSSLPLYFGLGNSKSVESIEILWPSGRKQRIHQPSEINTLLVIHETESN